MRENFPCMAITCRQRKSAWLFYRVSYILILQYICVTGTRYLAGTAETKLVPEIKIVKVE
jgi:hypothetical protein